MAYIKRFEIEGLAGRTTPVQRELDRYTNVFWGMNGGGKTSLLKILHSAMDNDASGLSGVPFTTAEVVIHNDTFDIDVVRTISSDDVNKSRDADDDFGETYAEDLSSAADASRIYWRSAPEPTVSFEGRSPAHMRFRHTYLPISRIVQNRSSPGLYGSRAYALRNGLSESSYDDIFADQVKRRWQTYTNKALAQVREIQQQGLASILAILFGGARDAAVRTMPLDASDAFERVNSFLREQQIYLRFTRSQFIERYKKQGELQQVVANIEEVTRQVEDSLRPQLEFQSIIDGLYSGDKHLVMTSRSATARNDLQVEIAGKSIPLQSLSSGEKQMLQLLLETLAADSTTVMIDEPELSMHVDWQLALVGSMRRVNPSCQLLLATHSPEVMTDVPGELVFEL